MKKDMAVSMFKGKNVLSIMFALLVAVVIAGAPTSADAATIYIYQGKGVGVMADTTSRWYDGNAGGVVCTFPSSHNEPLTYRFTRTANGWEYETFGDRPSYYDAKPIVNAILKYIMTEEVTDEYKNVTW